MTLLIIDGFEHGLTTTGIPGIYNNGGGTNVTSPVRSGARAWQKAAGSTFLGYTIAAGSRVATASFYFQFHGSLPSSGDTHPILAEFAGLGFVRFNRSTGFVNILCGANADVGPTIATGTWYRVDVNLDTSANPRVLKAIVTEDGQPAGTEVSVQNAAAATDITNARLGSGSATDGAAVTYDDWLVAVAASGATDPVYPIGEHSVEPLKPTGDGTHNISGANEFERSATGTDITNATTDAFELIDDQPLDVAPTDYINDLGTAAADYVEVTFADLPGGSDTPVDVRGYETDVNSGSGTTGGLSRVLLADGTAVTPDLRLSTDNPSTTLATRKKILDRPSGGWDRTKVDGLKARLGFGDGAPDVFFASLLLEVALVPPAPIEVDVLQATETDTAQAITGRKTRAVGQATETDSSGVVSTFDVVEVVQAVETDSAQAITARKVRAVGQATETDTAQAITHPQVVAVGQAVETDTAQAITVFVPLLEIGTAIEVDRAEQIAVIGGQLVVSDVPVLIRAPSKAGRIFHEIELRGDTYHPNIAGFVAEEEAPGGFGPARGRISERIFRAHRDVIRNGANWFVFHEDGTCLHAGRLLEPDTSEGEVQLVDRGVSSLAEREIGPVLYQAAVGDQFATMSGQSRKWSTSFGRMSHTHVDAGILFTRQSTDDSGVDNGPQVVIPLFGREPVFLRAHVQGTKAQLVIYTSRKELSPDTGSSAELDVDDLFENYFLTFAPTTGISGGEIEVDLTLGGNALTVPNDELTNVADEGTAGTGYVYPEVIVIEVGDVSDAGGGSAENRQNATEVLIANLEINGAPVGERSRFSASDLVADVASLIGIRFTQIEGGSFDILPYELPAGTPASEPLDYASLLTGKRARILHNGRRAVLEFGSWSENVWGLASPWSPFDAIPQDRYDAVAVPFFYGSTQLDDQVIVKMEDSPLDRRNIYWGLQLSDPAHSGDKARALGALVGEELIRKRNAGSFAAAEVLDRNGIPVSAHKVNAGDTIHPLRAHEPGRMRVSHLSRYEDHVEGTFDGGNHALERILARREKRMSARR